MPFIPVVVVDGSGGNFPKTMQTRFNDCGRTGYCGSLHFRDAHHAARVVPIFSDECLEDYRVTHLLLKNLRKDMKRQHIGAGIPSNGLMRSIHQNEHGYLPYKKDGLVSISSSSATAIARLAPVLGKLPHNQASVSAVTRGQFLEYTCADGMHVEGRLILDYRFGLMYMTFGHYHKDSFAMLVRSSAELSFEVKPTLPALDTVFLP
jgi:hypothetical protein